MANPRKFSEKIAMHNQKQAEETAAFDRIMKEVSAATITKPELSAQHFDGNSSADMSHARHGHERGRSMGIGPMRRPADRKIDTSPYTGGNMYLSLPNETYWRRTSSDSAIHQNFLRNHDDSSNRGIEPSSSTHSLHGSSAGSRRRRTNSCKSSDVANTTTNENSLNRPKSSCELSSKYADNSKSDTGMMSLVGNNTGSLPDLTSIHYPPPTHQYPDNTHCMQYNTFSSQITDYRGGRPSPTNSPTLYYPFPKEEIISPESPSSTINYGIGNYDHPDTKDFHIGGPPIHQPETKDFHIGPSIHQHFEQFSLYDDGYRNKRTYEYNAPDREPDYSAQKKYNENLYNAPDSANQPCTPTDDTNKFQTSENDLRMRMSKPYMYPTDPVANPMQQPAHPQPIMPITSQCCIPEIIFTDFSNTTENNTGDLREDPTRPIDLELGSMDFASYQMLCDANSTMVADQDLEDSFRQDLK